VTTIIYGAVLVGIIALAVVSGPLRIYVAVYLIALGLLLLRRPDV
jgi:hypothetical protein